METSAAVRDGGHRGGGGLVVPLPCCRNVAAAAPGGEGAAAAAASRTRSPRPKNFRFEATSPAPRPGGYFGFWRAPGGVRVPARPRQAPTLGSVTAPSLAASRCRRPASSPAGIPPPPGFFPAFARRAFVWPGAGGPSPPPPHLPALLIGHKARGGPGWRPDYRGRREFASNGFAERHRGQHRARCGRCRGLRWGWKPWAELEAPPPASFASHRSELIRQLNERRGGVPGVWPAACRGERDRHRRPRDAGEERSFGSPGSACDMGGRGGGQHWSQLGHLAAALGFTGSRGGGGGPRRAWGSPVPAAAPIRAPGCSEGGSAPPRPNHLATPQRLIKLIRICGPLGAV